MGYLSRVLGGPRLEASSTSSTSGTSSPEPWLLDLFGGVVTATGLRVTVKDALTVPGIAACIQVLSEDVAKVPFPLYRLDGGKTRSLALEHPLYSLIRSHPAPWLSSYDWRRAIVHNQLSRGNGYSRVHRDEAGRVVRLTLPQPGRVQQRWTSEGEPFFDVGGMSGEYARGLSYQDMIHLAYRGSNDHAENGGIYGVSPIQQHPEAIALAIAAERFAAKFFANGARPSVVIETEQKLPNDAVAARIRASVERAFAGVDNAFKVAVLELGMKLKEISFSNAESQLMEVRKEQTLAFCSMYRMPPHKIGILDRATFSNIEQQSIDYWTGPVSAVASGLENAVATACLSRAERDEYKPEMDLDDQMRGDMLSRYRAYAIGRQWGWLSADDIREWESQNPLPDGAGKTYITPLNMVPAKNTAGPDDEQDSGEENTKPADKAKPAEQGPLHPRRQPKK